MPKLSSFVKKGDRAERSERPDRREAKAPAKAPARAPEFDPVAKSTPRPDTGLTAAQLEEHQRTRRFRWPDGSLRKEKPPAKRNVVVARRDWEDIVDYCRRTGGCVHCTKGRCLLHGFGVSRAEREEYCREIGVWNQPHEDLKESLYMEERGIKAEEAAAV